MSAAGAAGGTGGPAVPPVRHKQCESMSNHYIIRDMLDKGLNPASVALLNKLLQLSVKPEYVHKLFCAGVEVILNALVRWIARAAISLVPPAGLHSSGGDGSCGCGGSRSCR